MGDMGESEPVPVRILIINPNTSVSMTDALRPMINALGNSAVSGLPMTWFSISVQSYWA